MKGGGPSLRIVGVSHACQAATTEHNAISRFFEEAAEEDYRNRPMRAVVTPKLRILFRKIAAAAALLAAATLTAVLASLIVFYMIIA